MAKLKILLNVDGGKFDLPEDPKAIRSVAGPVRIWQTHKSQAEHLAAFLELTKPKVSWIF